MNYLKIDTCNMNNGNGLRCVLWVTACSHRCPFCFNPETWDANNGDRFTEKQYQVIADTLSKNWCSGITLTGGDPLHPVNRKEIKNLCLKLKEQFPEKSIWAYTGYLFEEVKDFLKDSEIDVVIDGEFKNDLKSPFAHWVGSSNQRIIDVKKTLANPADEVVLYES